MYIYVKLQVYDGRRIARESFSGIEIILNIGNNIHVMIPILSTARFRRTSKCSDFRSYIHASSSTLMITGY